MSPLGVIFKEELLITNDELRVESGRSLSLMGLEIIREVDRKISSRGINILIFVF